MKVGIVCPYNIFLGGGVQECVKALQLELRSRGYQATIITPQPRDAKVRLNGTIFLGTAAQIKSPFHTTAQVSVSVKTDHLQELLDKEQFDILHFHEPWVPILSRQILARSNAINVATFHAKLPDTVMSKTIEKVITPYTKSILRDLDYLTAVSDAAASYVKTLTDNNVSIIPNGVDLSKFTKQVKSSKKTNSILYIGRLEKRKGVKYLLKAFKAIQAECPDVELLIAGDGPDAGKLKQFVTTNRISKVRFLGYVTEQKKLSLMSHASLFCSPALYGESFGIVLLEAMAMGLPIVAGDNPGYRAVMKETGQVSLVNPKDTTSFARGLKLMLTDITVRDTWQNWAESYVKQFDYKMIVDQYEKVYKTANKL